jgi:hypothetical protein
VRSSTHLKNCSGVILHFYRAKKEAGQEQEAIKTIDKNIDARMAI